MKQDESYQFFKEIIVSKAVNEILLSLVVYATMASPIN
jgi:hypothetical protein